MNLCVVLPKWRPRGRGDRGGRSPHATRPHGRLRAVTQDFALRALPLRGPDNSWTQHPIHPFNVGAPSVSFPPAEPLKNEGCEAASARSARLCVTAGKRPQGRAACGESPPQNLGLLQNPGRQASLPVRLPEFSGAETGWKPVLPRISPGFCNSPKTCARRAPLRKAADDL